MARNADLVAHFKEIHEKNLLECSLCQFSSHEITDMTNHMKNDHIKVEMNGSDTFTTILESKKCPSVRITAKQSSAVDFIPDITTEKLFEIKLTHSKPSACENDAKITENKAKMVKIVSIKNKQRREKESRHMQTIYKDGKTVIDPMELIRKQMTPTEDPLSIVKQELHDFEEYQVTSYTAELQRKIYVGSYACDLCPLKFNEKFTVEVHMNVAHKNPIISDDLQKLKMHKLNHFQPFECEMCKNIFDTRRALLDHQKIMHMKDCQCEVCGKYFKNMTYVKRHVKTTHGELPLMLFVPF